jgi:hypothetical protein
VVRGSGRETTDSERVRAGIYRFKQELERSSKLPFASHWRERSLGGLVNLAQKEAAKLASRGGYGRSEHHAVSGEVIELNMR